MGGLIEYVQVEPANTASPCVNICEIDNATGWCLGCGRTIDEIACWSARPHDQRRAIRAALPARMAALRSRADTAR